MAGVVPGLNSMAAGLQAAKTGAMRHGATMAIGAMGGYAASDDGIISTTAGMIGGAGLGLAASQGAFGASIKKASMYANSVGATAASTAMAVAREGYSGAKMYCNKGVNKIKSTMKG